MQKPVKAPLYTLFILLTYTLFYYFYWNQQINVDFSSLYAAALAYQHKMNPYVELSGSFLLNPMDLEINLNPPFHLLFFTPLTYFNYSTAAFIWSISNLILGIVGCLMCFYLTSTKRFFKNNILFFILIYLSCYATLMNTNFNQIAGFLLFLIMAGYSFYVKRNDYAAGLFWGLAVALKLFPGLLMIFVLSDKRYKTFITTLLCVLITWSIPLYFRGVEIYLSYFKIINSLLWYGNSWNASLYGFLFRQFANFDVIQNLVPIKVTYQIFFALIVIWYTRTLQVLKNIPHAAFSLTLIIMLLLSPLGWMYYFSLLIMPLILISKSLSQQDNNKMGLWCLCLFLLNMPIANVQTRYIEFFIYKITLYSIYFYGLIFLIYLFLKATRHLDSLSYLNDTIDSGNLLVLELFLGLSVVTVLATLLMHL